MVRDPDAWTLVQNRGWIPEDALLPALRKTAELEPDPCYRTRMLVHDALDALAARWGEDVVRRRMGSDSAARRLAEYWADEYDKVGFWSIPRRLVNPTTPDIIRKFLRELGDRIRHPASISIGGSCSLLVTETLVRSTEDMDVVNELPEVIRTDHQLVNYLADKYQLRLSHFASHYLPNNWQNRTRSLGQFSKLDARIVDPIDVLTGKLFSKRQKDGKDVLACLPNIEMDVLRDRLQYNTIDLRKDERLLEAARHNWYVLTGEETLP